MSKDALQNRSWQIKTAVPRNVDSKGVASEDEVTGRDYRIGRFAARARLREVFRTSKRGDIYVESATPIFSLRVDL